MVSSSYPSSQPGSGVLAPLARSAAPSLGATIRQSVRTALAGLATHKLRSALTLLGLLVGIAGVLLIVALAQLTGGATAQRLAGLGANMVDVQGFVLPANLPAPSSGQPVAIRITSPPTLTSQDVHAVRALPHVVAASPVMPADETVVAGDHSSTTSVVGAYPDVQIIRGYTLQSGAFFSDADVGAVATKAVLGQAAASTLFPNGGAVGQQVRIGNVDFTVVGVLKAIGQSGNENPDNVVVVPVTTWFQRLSGPRVSTNGAPPRAAAAAKAAAGANGPPAGVAVYTAGNPNATPNASGQAGPSDAGNKNLAFSGNFPDMQVEADSAGDVPLVKTEITKALEQTHYITGGLKDDFTVGGFALGAQVAQQSTKEIAVAMASVAGVALLIGGAGVANVMLAAVSERRREIGVRLAVGAQPRDLLLQFLLEAVTLSLAGGVLGVLAGLALALELPRLLPGLTPGGIAFAGPFSPLGPLAALGAAVIVGLLFGVYPASRASRLDPIAALR